MNTEKILEIKAHINALTNFLQDVSILDLQTLEKLENSVLSFEFAVLGKLCTLASQEMFLNEYFTNVLEYYSQGLLDFGRTELENSIIHVQNGMLTVYDKEGKEFADFNKSGDWLMVIFYEKYKLMIELSGNKQSLNERVVNNNEWIKHREFMEKNFAEIQKYVIKRLSQ